MVPLLHPLLICCDGERYVCCFNLLCFYLGIDVSILLLFLKPSVLLCTCIHIHPRFPSFSYEKWALLFVENCSIHFSVP